MSGFMMNRLYFPNAEVALKPIAWLVFAFSLSTHAWGQSGAAHIGFEEEQTAARIQAALERERMKDRSVQ